MSDYTYIRYIYQWLIDSGLSGSTTTIVSQFTILFDRLNTIMTKLDNLLTYSSNILSALVFFVLLWFGMQFVQKRWYST